MPTLIWIALGMGAWTLCGVLAVAIACAARRGDRLSSGAVMEAAQAVAPRPRMVVDATAVARPWAGARTGSTVVESMLAEAAPSR